MATPEALGRELADMIAAVKRPLANRIVRIWYVEVISVASPYFVGRFDNGTELRMLHGEVVPIVGRTWRVRQILGLLVGDDWATNHDI